MVRRHYTNGFVDIAITAVEAVLTQDEPSNGPAYESGYNPCWYHGIEGRKSIMGHLITDEHYSLDIEKHPPYNVNVMGAVVVSLGKLLSPDEKLLLCDLEDCHDDASDIYHAKGGAFEVHLRHVIQQNMVKFPEEFERYCNVD